MAARRSFGRLQHNFETIADIDYYLGATHEKIAVELVQVEASYQTHINPGEYQVAASLLGRTSTVVGRSTTTRPPATRSFPGRAYP
ncbi:MAG: hypothetical protein ACYCY1_15550 [Sulfuriferula sp.]